MFFLLIVFDFSSSSSVDLEPIVHLLTQKREKRGKTSES